jgi:hypothetical protein
VICTILIPQKDRQEDVTAAIETAKGKKKKMRQPKLEVLKGKGKRSDIYNRNYSKDKTRCGYS